MGGYLCTRKDANVDQQTASRLCYENGAPGVTSFEGCSVSPPHVYRGTITCAVSPELMSRYKSYSGRVAYDRWHARDVNTSASDRRRMAEQHPELLRYMVHNYAVFGMIEDGLLLNLHNQNALTEYHKHVNSP